MAKEHAALKGAGFDDEDEIQRVIEMRWQKLQTLKGDDVAAEDVEEEEDIGGRGGYLPPLIRHSLGYGTHERGSRRLSPHP